jgi:hypothetical protein
MAPTLSVVARYVADVVNRCAEAGGTNHRAIGTRQAALSDLIPARMLEILVKNVLDAGGVNASHLAGCCLSDCRFHLIDVFLAGGEDLYLGQHSGATIASGLNQKPMSL